ncbi:hypothetical protein MHBO_003248 [Bonamia ostreae]|uniref:Uncharacterized protein n=1 Tax=Bonamia ostreae TaxID=126728 RepID=A0ABV2APW2_9EUKA
MFNFDELVKVEHSTLNSRLDDKISKEKSDFLAKKAIESFSEPLVSVQMNHPFKYSQISSKQNESGNFKTFAISEKTMKLSKTERSDEDYSNEISVSMSLDSESFSTSFVSEENLNINFDQLVKNQYFEILPLGNIQNSLNVKESAILQCYNSSYEKIETEHERPEIWELEPTTQFAFYPLKFSMHYGNLIEPFFCRAALYDISANKRISEFAEFAFNKEEEKCCFVFNCDPSPDIVLAVQINHIYSKDIEKSSFPHFNNQIDVSTSQKRLYRESLKPYENVFTDYLKIN